MACPCTHLLFILTYFSRKSHRPASMMRYKTTPEVWVNNKRDGYWVCAIFSSYFHVASSRCLLSSHCVQFAINRWIYNDYMLYLAMLWLLFIDCRHSQRGWWQLKTRGILTCWVSTLFGQISRRGNWWVNNHCAPVRRFTSFDHHISPYQILHGCFQLLTSNGIYTPAIIYLLGQSNV